MLNSAYPRFLLIGCLTILVQSLLTLATCAQEAQGISSKPKLILDADTANEIDDLYAIIRMVRQDKFDLLAVTSAQWFHYYGDRESTRASQRLNEDLIRLLDRQDLPIPMGSEEAMGKPWGGFQPRESPAARFIIEAAMAMPEGEKLTVASIGAMTNLASAVAMKPEIAKKIRAHSLGFRYDRATGIWNKNEFNIRRDLNAADYLLNQKDLELHIMTTTTSRPYKFDRDKTFMKQSQMGNLGNYLTQRWRSRTPHVTRWTMWDLAAVQALLHPGMAKEEQVMTPPENTQRKVWVYYEIDVDRMRNDFWESALTQKANH